MHYAKTYAYWQLKALLTSSTFISCDLHPRKVATLCGYPVVNIPVKSQHIVVTL